MTGANAVSATPAPVRADWPTVTVIVPVRNEGRHLGETLRCLLEGDYPVDRMEVLVVDGCSTDATADVAAEIAATDRRVRLLRNTRLTAPAGLNVGLAAAAGDVVVRLDGHARPAPDYVRRCVDALDRTGATAVGGMLVGRGITSFGRAVAVAGATPLGAGYARYRLGGEGPVDTVYLGAWHRADLERLGGFDEALPRNQDYELCERIRASGGTVWLDPRIKSDTVVRSDPASLAAQYFGYGAGRAATVAKHRRSLRARQAVPAGVVGLAALLGAAAMWSATARRALGALAAAYTAAVAAASLVAAGGRSGRNLRGRDAGWLPVAYGVMHGAWGAGFWSGLARTGVKSLAAVRRRSGDPTDRGRDL